MTSVLSFTPPRAPASPAILPGAAESAFDPARSGRLFWTSTARAALRPVLLHLRKTGALPDKNGEVLAPRWACTSLYNTLQKACFPTVQDTPSLRGVLVYHQYGFPQRLDRIAQRCRDRGLFLIENNVNCVFSGAPAHGIGDAGLASIFSLPKMFRTVLGGALLSRDAGLTAFCEGYFREDEPWIGRLGRATRRLHERFPDGAQRLQEMVYALSDYARAADPGDVERMRADFAGGAVARRKENYARLRREFADAPFFHGLEEDVVPYVAPLFGPPEFLSKLAAALSRAGWESGVYRFDAARDLFAPDFVPCVPLPVHQGLAPADMDALVEIVRSQWRSHNGQR